MIAAGVPALSGKLSHAGAANPAAVSPAGKLPGGFRLVTPVVPAQIRRGPYVQDTRRAVAQLMLDGLPRAHG